MNTNEFDNASGHLRHSIKNQEQFLEALIVRLESSLPGCIFVVRAFAPFAKKKPLKALEIKLNDDVFKLTFSKYSGVQTTIATAVRGIVLKNHAVAFADWMQTLNEKLKEHAKEHSQTEDILEDFLL